MARSWIEPALAVSGPELGGLQPRLAEPHWTLMTLGGCRQSKLSALRDASLLDHLVGLRQQRFRDGEAERFGTPQFHRLTARNALNRPRSSSRRAGPSSTRGVAWTNQEVPLFSR